MTRARIHSSRGHHTWLILGLLLTLLSTHGAAQEEFFAEGNRLYQDGDYAGAVERYERIVEAGYDSGALRYNIGNAYFKLGDLGKAILNYERSLRLSPRDEDARANLELARSLTVDQVTPLPGFWLFRVANWWVHLLSRGLLTILVAAAYLMTTAATVVFVLRRGSPLAAWCARLAVVAGAVTVVFAINLAAIDLGIGVSEEAVVMVDEVAVHSAPSDDSSLQIFAIHEGTKIRVDRRSEEWVEVVLEDGKVGWVPVDALETI